MESVRSPLEEGYGEGAMSLPEKKIDFGSQNGVLGTIFYRSPVCFKTQKAVLLGSENLLCRHAERKRDQNKSIKKECL